MCLWWGEGGSYHSWRKIARCELFKCEPVVALEVAALHEWGARTSTRVACVGGGGSYRSWRKIARRELELGGFQLNSWGWKWERIERVSGAQYLLQGSWRWPSAWAGRRNPLATLPPRRHVTKHTSNTNHSPILIGQSNLPPPLHLKYRVRLDFQSAEI